MDGNNKILLSDAIINALFIHPFSDSFFYVKQGYLFGHILFVF